MISEDLDEMLELSDRIAVMYEGRIVGIVKRGEATPEEIGLLMAGVVKEQNSERSRVIVDVDLRQADEAANDNHLVDYLDDGIWYDWSHKRRV